MGCIQTKAAGTKEDSRLLARGSSTGRSAASRADRPTFERLSTHIPDSGPLSQQDYWDRLDLSPTQTARTGSYILEFAYVSQRGLYPDQEGKKNQDAVYVKTNFGGRPDQHFFGVFDGHGAVGDDIANFAKYKVPENVLAYPRLAQDPAAALSHAMTWTNEQLHIQGGDEMSGTTAITCLFQGETVWVANVGDSRALAILKSPADGLTAEALSSDQTPFRDDELQRVKRAGAVVYTLDQMENVKTRDVDTWDEEEDGGDPPRLWKPGQMYPGTAFTRSIGDRVAESIGVIADPELRSLEITSNHHCIVIASDGVFEFIKNEQIAEIVGENEDPQEAAVQMVAEAYRLWLTYETRTDDISAIVIYIRHPEPEPIAPSPMTSAHIPLSKSVGNLASTQLSGTSIPSTPSGTLSGLTLRSKSTLERVLSRQPSQAPSSLASLKSNRTQDVFLAPGALPPLEPGSPKVKSLQHSTSEPCTVIEKLATVQSEDLEQPSTSDVFTAKS